MHALDMHLKTKERLRIIVLEGEFIRGDAEKFVEFVKKNKPIDEVLFSSPGGFLYEGLSLGRRMREFGFLARIPNGATCASACAWAFLGGQLRIVDSGGRYGDHMATMISNDQLVSKFKSILERASSEESDTVLRLIMALTEKAAAQAAATKAEYLVKMGVSLRLLAPGVNTDAWDMYWFSAQELRAYNVTNIER